MAIDPSKSKYEITDASEHDAPARPELADGAVPEQIEIEVDDPTITDEFEEADFDHEFDDDFEEEIEGEYDLEDDQYGQEFTKEFGHLTKDEDSKTKGKDGA